MEMRIGRKDAISGERKNSSIGSEETLKKSEMDDGTKRRDDVEHSSFLPGRRERGYGRGGEGKIKKTYKIGSFTILRGLSCNYSTI